jgi:predicted RND superfamily exporter protein
VYFYPPAGQWEVRVPEAVVDAIEGTGEGVVVTGIVPSFNEISGFVKEEFLGLTLAAMVVVLLIAILFLRRPLFALLSAVPAVVGLIWTLGLMQLGGIELNLVTILVAPMIIGLGIDYALHVLNRHLEQPDRIDASIASVSRAILMTSATTIIGFGSLAFADLASLRALGLTVSLGMVCCAVTSLVLLPAMLRAFAAR